MGRQTCNYVFFSHGISFILCMLGVRMLRDIIFWKNINIYFKLKLDFKSLNYIELIKFYFILFY
jgi:hypothetical protein